MASCATCGLPTTHLWRPTSKKFYRRCRGWLSRLSPVGDIPRPFVEWAQGRSLDGFDLRIGRFTVDQRHRNVGVDDDVVHLHPQLRRLLHVRLTFDLVVQLVVVRIHPARVVACGPRILLLRDVDRWITA